MNIPPSSKFKPDLIECFPEHLDFPLHRKFLMENRHRFSKVIIVFTQMNAGTGDYRKFVRTQLMDYDITFLNNDYVGDKDWRDVAVNKALKSSDNEWVWFTEQDFTPEQFFWSSVEYLLCFGGDFIGVMQDERMHPCCLFVKRSVIDKTSKDFSANPPSHDHFGQFTKDLTALRAPGHILPSYVAWESEEQRGKENGDAWTHLNGLSQNLYLLQKGEEPNYRPEDFKKYCQDTLASGIAIPVHLEVLMKQYIDR